MEEKKQQVGYEKRDVNIKVLFLVAAVIVTAIVLSLIGLNEYFFAVKEEVVYENVLKPESETLRKLRAKEDEILGSYQLIDSVQGVYRIPIERAMELVVQEAGRQEKK
jgi:hypothetical protein